MWTVVFVAKNKDEAKRITQKLGENRIITKMRPLSGNEYEVLVPYTEIEYAHDIILD